MKSYDPTLTYDPTVKLSFSGGGYVEEYRAQNPAQWAKLDIVLTAGAANTAGTVDLFNFYRSSSIVFDPDVLNNESAFVALTGAQLWDAGGGDSVTAQCTQLPYRSLFQALGVASIHIALVRMIASIPALNPFSPSIDIRKKTFLGGQVINDINPSAFLSPDQFQVDRVDIPLNLVVDGETGLYVTVAGALQVITLSLFIDRYKKTYGGASLKQ